MNQDQRMRLEQQYAQYSDEGLLDAAGSGRDDYQEGVYDIILAEVKRRRLEDELDERLEFKRRTKEIQEDGLDLVLLRRFTFMHEAEYAKNLLQDNDIEAVILKDDYGTAPSAVSFGIQQARLLVLEDDFEMADEILKSMEDEE